MYETKADYRMVGRARRDALSADERAAWSQAIADQVLAREEYRQAECIFSYVTMRGEVDTASVVGDALAAGKAVVIPYTDWARRQIVPVRLSDPMLLVPGRFGVPEPPVDARQVWPVEAIELVLVPGLAFDVEGHRVGYGGGFFDRFLPRLQSEVHAWGLAFEAQVFQRVPAGPSDMAVEAVVTERRWLEPKRP